jgi:tryptophanyl-tRNA synthetase
MSLLEPTKKMSKSLGGGHVLELVDEPAVVLAKIKKAVTANEGSEDASAPGVDNLLMLLKQFGTKEDYETFVEAEKDGSIRYGDLKTTLAEAISTSFESFRTKRAELLKNPTELEAILARGAESARLVAKQTLADVYKLVGLR